MDFTQKQIAFYGCSIEGLCDVKPDPVDPTPTPTPVPEPDNKGDDTSKGIDKKLLFVIIGASAGVLIVLVAVVCIYRSKMNALKKKLALQESQPMLPNNVAATPNDPNF